MGSENDRIRVAVLREELRQERAARARAEAEVHALRDELDRTRAFLEALPEFGCTLETTVAVQELLMSSPNLAGKPRG